MAEYVKIYFKNSGTGRNELKKESNGSFTFNVGKEGFDAKSSQDQWWIIDALKRAGIEIGNDNNFKYEIGKRFPGPDSLVGSTEIKID